LLEAEKVNLATSLKEFIAYAQDRLAAAGIDNPGLDVRLLVQHVMGWQQAKLLTSFNYMPSEVQVKDLNTAIDRRVKREPVSRIIGHRGFWKSEFKITPQTLDPRPDSETLIESTLKHVQPAPSSILDLGTGTGCLLLSLLIEYPSAKGVGVDISEEAVATAKENALHITLPRRTPGSQAAESETPAFAGVGKTVAERAEFVATDWEKYQPPAPFDLVISNPPYIAESEMKDLSPEVTHYDPRAALVSGPEGLECYRSISGLLKNWLKPGGWAVFEIGHSQSEAVKSILAEAGMVMIQVVPDLAGSDRVIVARRP
jgi:release factor glutamine methyltransferase